MKKIGYKYLIENHGDEIKKLYLEDKLTLKEIGVIYGGSYNLISRTLREMNVPIRTKSESLLLVKSSKLDSMIGNKYERLLVKSRSEINDSYVIVDCDCGKLNHHTCGYSILQGRTKSCGCLTMENLLIRNKENSTHNQSKNKLYHIHKSMKRRCTVISDKRYVNYGGRGIKVCDEWLGDNGLFTFINWSEQNGYEEGLSIDRINNDGNYEPSNCRWITVSENTAKRNTEYALKNKKSKGGN